MTAGSIPSCTLSGLITVDKPVGPSSMDVVRQVRRAAAHGCGHKRVKVGHADTLDPLASGLMICCLGQATRCVDQLMNLPKVYDAIVNLSAFSSTDDREGQFEPVSTHPPTLEVVGDACGRFVGDIQQTPPVYSAVHVNGKRAYALARRGLQVQLKPRQVRIDQIELLDYSWPLVQLRISCGRGTYIRSLARDLGHELQTGGHLETLRRTAVGSYTVQQANPISRFEQSLYQEDLLPKPG